MTNQPNKHDPVKGNPNAPITIVEFSDFQCSFYERFFIGNEKIGYGMVSGAQPYPVFQQVFNQLLAS